MILAYRIEQEFTKEEILELYLNTTFFGQRAYGVATAAQTYFGKNLDALSISEIAILAGIPQRPPMEPALQHRQRRGAGLRAAAHERDRRDQRGRVRSGARGAHPRPAVRLAVAARGAVRRRDGARRDGRAVRQRRDDGRAQGDDDDRQSAAGRGAIGRCTRT